MHTKTMLLIYDNQRELLELNLILEQSMRPHCHTGFTIV